LSDTPQDPSTELLVRDEGHVRVLTLNRPERRNALSKQLSSSLMQALLEADEDDAVRVVIVTGSGERAFCSGADLKDIRAQDDAGIAFKSPFAKAERNIFEVAVDLKKPTIAAINGSAVAGGLELALACDLRIASEAAELGVPEAKVGMAAHFASVTLARRIPTCFALEMLFTGDYISAKRALELGLVNRVVSAAQVMAESLALANRIAGNAPVSVRRMKAMATKGLDLPLMAALRLDIGPNPYFSEDRAEGIRARLEKRAPVWRGK
jgi:enoyl-CoA hydratase